MKRRRVHGFPPKSIRGRCAPKSIDDEVYTSCRIEAGAAKLHGNKERSMRPIAGWALALSLFGSGAASAELKAGDTAPDFELAGTDGMTYKLSSLKGKTVVLAWFPKAFTSG
jgi:hypothetical protein